MKSTEVYATLRAELSPAMKALGFKRQKAFLSWARLRSDLHTVIWCQVSRDGWDDYAGSKFVVELQRSEGPEPGMSSSKRMRLAKLVDDQVREAIRSIQNEAISSLHSPPRNHTALQVSPEVTRGYMRKFEPERAPYSPLDDLWFRYAQPEHVKRWGQLIVQLLPRLVEGIESAA
jgi:hypothetical protein